MNDPNLDTQKRSEEQVPELEEKPQGPLAAYIHDLNETGKYLQEEEQTVFYTVQGELRLKEISRIINEIHIIANGMDEPDSLIINNLRLAKSILGKLLFTIDRGPKDKRDKEYFIDIMELGDVLRKISQYIENPPKPG